MNADGVRQVKLAVQLAAEALRDSRHEAARAVYHLELAVNASWCALTGWHSWGPWRKARVPFMPPETRMCSRCTTRQHRGGWPLIKVEAGTISPTGRPRFLWTEDGGL